MAKTGRRDTHALWGARLRDWAYLVVPSCFTQTGASSSEPPTLPPIFLCHHSNCTMPEKLGALVNLSPVLPLLGRLFTPWVDGNSNCPVILRPSPAPTVWVWISVDLCGCIDPRLGLEFSKAGTMLYLSITLLIFPQICVEVSCLSGSMLDTGDKNWKK